MLNHQLLKFDPEGRVILTTAEAVYFNGGTPIALDGGLAGTGGALPDAFLGGIGYTNIERLTDSDNPLVPGEGPLTNRDGQVRISTDLPTHWYAGLPITAEGFLAVSPGVVPPVDLGAFNNSFDNSFDIGD